MWLAARAGTGRRRARPELRLCGERRPRHVQKIELATNKIVKTIHIATDAASHGVSFGNGGRLLFITNTGTSTVSIIDTTKDEVVDTVKVSTAPEGIAFKKES